MSAFTQLLAEAGRVGVVRLLWSVDPRDYRQDDGVERWECEGQAGGAVVSDVDMPRGVITIDCSTQAVLVSRRGRSGEEALRRVVEAFGGVVT